jgi:hypothetical protein
MEIKSEVFDLTFNTFGNLDRSPDIAKRIRTHRELDCDAAGRHKKQP